MGKYFCDYCDVFLVSESPSVRKAHNSGRNHLTNVRDYYASMGHDKAQNIIDEITRMYENGPPPNQRPQINNFGPGPGMLAPRPPLPPQNFSAPPPSFGGPPPQNLPPMRFPGGGPPPGPPGGFGPPGGGDMSPPPPPASAPVSGPAGRMDPTRAKMLGLA